MRLTISVAAIVLATLLPGRGQAARAPRDRPNFVILFVDDMGYGDVGFTGHPTTSTPNIDKLAYNGKVLTTWYSGCPVCSGSRAALMTGRHYTRVGVPGVFSGNTNVGLPLNETTVAEQLKKANYTSAIVGKWHLGQREVYLPGNRGFDHYLGIPYSDDLGQGRATSCNSTEDAMKGINRSLATNGWQKAAYKELGYLKPDYEVQGADHGPDYVPLVHQDHGKTTVLEQPLDFTTLGDKYNKFATDFIGAHKDEPFLLYIPFSHVHTTAENLPERQYSTCPWKNSSRRGAFGDALSEVDWIVGNVHKALQDNGLEENTLILFTSDNGPWMHFNLSSGSPGIFYGRFSGYYNTGKGSTWEGGHRMPAFAYWKGQIDQASRSAEVVSSLDVFPTISELAGLPLPVDRVFDGRDMGDILLKEDGHTKHEFLFFYGGCLGDRKPSAVRYGKWKAHWCTGPGLNSCIGCETKRYIDTPLLFNIENDPSEGLPLNPNGEELTVPVEAAAALSAIKKAYSEWVVNFTTQTLIPEPDSEEEKKSGMYGVCCDRTKDCDCDGPVYDNCDSELENCCLSSLQTCTKCKYGSVHDGYGCKRCDSGHSCYAVLGLQCPSGFACGGGYYTNACCISSAPTQVI